MKPNKTHIRDKVGMFNGGTRSISLYDKSIKKKGVLSRHDEIILFEKIIHIQEEIIHECISDIGTFNILKQMLKYKELNDTFMDIFNFKATMAYDCTEEDIVNSYIAIIHIYLNAKTKQDIPFPLIMLTFSCEFFDEFIGNISQTIIDKFNINTKLDIIEHYRQRIFEHNIALVIDIAVTYSNENSSLTKDDLIQEGMVGLKRAIKKHNPYMGTKFSTMACAWIAQEIIREIDNKARLIAIPCNILSNYKKIAKRINKLTSERGNILSNDEIIELTGDDSIKYGNIDVICLDSEYTNGGDRRLSLHEVIEDNNIMPVDMDIIINEMNNKIRETINNLTDIESIIIRKLFGIGEYTMNNKSIMEELNLCTYNYNKIRNSALSKLRESLETDPFFNGWQNILEGRE